MTADISKLLVNLADYIRLEAKARQGFDDEGEFARWWDLKVNWWPKLDPAELRELAKTAELTGTGRKA